MSLDITPLEKAARLLQRSLSVTELNENFTSLSLEEQETLQAGVIRNFEVLLLE